jgi:hypothetical protein
LHTHEFCESENGLTTTADKIRALAHADYGRTEISKILGIRYQHVRNGRHDSWWGRFPAPSDCCIFPRDRTQSQ